MVMIILIAVAMVYDYDYQRSDVLQDRNCTCYELQMKKLSNNLYQDCIKRECDGK